MDTPGAIASPPSPGAPAGGQPGGGQPGAPGGAPNAPLGRGNAPAGGDGRGKHDLDNLAKGKDGKPPAEPGKQPGTGEPDPNKKIWKLNVYGKDQEFDASDEESVKKIVQKGLAADQRFAQAAEVEKQMQTLVRALRENPEKVLLNERLGHNPEMLVEKILSALGPKARKAAEKYMSQIVDEELMDPKDREILQHKRKLEEYEAQKKDAENKARMEQIAQAKAHYQGEYERDIVSALESSGLPKTAATVKRMAYYLYQGLQRGIELKAADVVDLVKKDYTQEQIELFGATDGDALLSILGPELTQKVVRAATVAAKNGKLAPSKVPPGKQPPPGSDENKGKKRYISPDEWRDKMGI